ncbi:MAG: RidA family protein, partial [Vicinamibacterales bacterium]
EPAALGRPSGFSHGLLGPAGGRVLFVAGQTAPGITGASAPDTLVAQFDAALARVLEVVGDAGGNAGHIGRMTVYVTDMAAYRAGRARLTPIWRARMGRHYPAMAVVAVTALVEPDAVLEIEATAVLP